jgi:hypothetical protein
MAYMIADDSTSSFMNEKEGADSNEATPKDVASLSEACMNDGLLDCEKAASEPTLPDWMMSEVA